jgi:transposase-like protein
MRYEVPKFDSLRDMAFIDVSRLTENEALAILEKLRWPSGVACPHCGDLAVSQIEGKAKTVRDGLYRCYGCKSHFTVMVGTVMEDSHITYRQWIQAFFLMCSSKKGISALQLQRNLGLGSYRSAWHLAHRIRVAMQKDPIAKKLKGIVEVDETYIGGKPRKGTGIKNKRGRGTEKAPVMLMVERDGKAVSKPIERVNAKTLKTAIKETVNKNSTIMTDEWRSYNGIGKSFKGGHKVVNHGIGQYVNGTANTNTAESYFALLKRGVHGTFHHVSKKHLAKYCNEFSFRWNNRETNDGERTVKAVKGFEGKRLMLKELLGS